MFSLQFITLFLFVGLIYSQTIEVIQTARDNNDRLTKKPSIQFNTTQLSDFPWPHNVTVDRTFKFQEIIGFGGCLNDITAIAFSQINNDLQDQVIEAYFGKTGIGYSICRTNINSCNTPVIYSFDDTPNDYELKNFNVAHNQKTMIPLLKRVLNESVVPVKLFASPWSPPGWMKRNGQMQGSDHPGLIQDPKIFASWALYFSKFVTEYHNNGIDLWGITIQNEPEFAAPYEACCYTAEEQRDFLKYYLGPQLRKDHPDLVIMIFDHNKDHVADWARTFYTDPVASSFADGTAFHWYSGFQFQNLALAHSIAPSKFLLATEADNEHLSLDNWEYGEAFAYDIIGDLNNWAIGWVHWNALGTRADAPIQADIDAQKLFLQPMYWYIGQFSKYITPGSTVLNSYIYDDTVLQVVSVLTKDGKTVVVVLNRNDFEVTYTLQDGNKAASVTSPPHSIQTLIYTM